MAIPVLRSSQMALMTRSLTFLGLSGLLICILHGTGSSASSQLQTLPGSVVRGERVLTANGCLNCHALKGQGGTRAPDLSVPSKTAATPDLFAASIWNHVPAMVSEIEASKTPAPILKVTDAADLFAYLYSTLYFSPRGNASRGGSLFVEKQCSSCHSEVLNTDRKDGLQETWMDLKDPSVWAERMWNHATEMESAMKNRGIRWPKFSDQEVVDLMTFLGTRAGTQSEAYELSVGDPELGRAVFARSCTTCHTLGQREKSKVDLLARKGPTSVTGYIAAMWNHAPEMKNKGGATVKLASGQMADLVAFLFSQRYFFEPGDSERGKKVYESNNCALCHERQRAQTGAPDLTKTMEAYSPIVLTSAAWQHGATMIQTMKRQQIDWPEFHGREMADLIAFLNSRLILRVAQPR
jgi:cytochrome c